MLSQSAEIVMVFRTGHLGDTICALPAFQLIRKEFCNAKLLLLCDKPDDNKVAVSDVLNNLNIFDSIYTYSSNKGISTYIQIYNLLSKIKPNILIQLPPLRKSAFALKKQKFFFRLAGIKTLFGFHSPVMCSDWNVSEPERLINILNHDGISGKKPLYKIPQNENSYRNVSKKLHAIGLSINNPYIVFCGGGKAETQRWPIERYAKVLHYVDSITNVPIIAIGNVNEFNIYKQEILPIFPKLHLLPVTIDELIELLRSSMLYIGNDTGPIHLAAAVGCPVIGILSARNLPGQWDPDIEKKLIIRHRTECEGCWLDVCTKEHHKCMTLIEFEDVISKIKPFIDSIFSDH